MARKSAIRSEQKVGRSFAWASGFQSYIMKWNAYLMPTEAWSSMGLSIDVMQKVADSSIRYLVGVGVFGEEDGVCNIAYLLGRAQSMYGEDSAVSVGLRKGLDDALNIASIHCSENCVNKVIMLGRRHGALFRSNCWFDKFHSRI
ncbi:hypothetical protein [Burkholderia cepacia]|uniref:hypothetical protein n=1 Tax=Burkholderia cepacia TaxID=292 RepID=UPI00158BD80B|nr:hypothetical protein [Burkholderia cepacia]